MQTLEGSLVTSLFVCICLVALLLYVLAQLHHIMSNIYVIVIIQTWITLACSTVSGSPPLVSGRLSDIPRLFLPETTHTITVFRPQWGGAVSWGCEDQQPLSHLQNFHTHQWFVMSLPTPQQWRPLTRWLCRTRTLQMAGGTPRMHATFTRLQTPSHRVWAIQRKVTYVPDVQPAFCVSRDQHGVSSLIRAQAQHTLTRLLWSIELACSGEEKQELPFRRFPNRNKQSLGRFSS